MKYKVSVVVPTYNSGLFLNAFMDSVMCQSIDFENIQVIFVDDNSDDEYTLYLLKLFDENFSNVKSILLNENNGFPGKGRNLGIDYAEAEYIIFSDHDDTYVPDAFEVMYDVAISNNADMVITNYYKLFNDNKVKTKSIFNGENVVVSDFREDRRLLSLDPAIWTKLFKKSFLVENNIKFLEKMLAEDLYFFTVSLFKSQSTVYLDDFYSYNYNVRDIEGNRSTIHIRNKKYLGKMVEGYYEIDKFLKDNNLEEFYSEIFKTHFIYWITSLTFSDVSDEDKLELIKFNSELLKKQLKITPNFDEAVYEPITKPLLKDEYKKVVSRLKFIKSTRLIAHGVFDLFRR